jgi:hypothetical protein
VAAGGAREAGARSTDLRVEAGRDLAGSGGGRREDTEGRPDLVVAEVETAGAPTPVVADSREPWFETSTVLWSLVHDKNM